MFWIINYIDRRLHLKILMALTIGAAIVMGVVIWLGVRSQRDQIRERMTTYGRELKFLAMAGIRHPMSVGDSASVEKQLMDVRESLKDTEIAICDFNGRIVFATHTERINTSMAEFIHQGEALAALRRRLDNGPPQGGQFFEEEDVGRKYLVSIHGMANEPGCFHCHGDQRTVLGGLIIRQSTDETYAAIAALRNRTILISVLGIAAIVMIIYYLLARLVTRPITDLARKAEQLALGDLTVSVQVTTSDSVGILGNAFNTMTRSIKEQIEFANSLKIAIADPLFMVDTDMTITYMNEACVKLTGFNREEAEHLLTCHDIFQSDICASTCPVRQCFKNGEPVANIRVMMTDRQGRRIPIMASASPLRDAHGRIIGGVEICRDITDVLEAERSRYIQKTADRQEEERRMLEERAKNLLAVLAKTSEGNLQVRADITGQNEVMDQIARHTNHMLDNVEKLYQKIWTFSRELEQEVARRTMMLRDKTLLLEQANRELRELDRLKTSFLANMSHELRTPMNSIIGYTDLLLDQVDGPINEEQEKSLHRVEGNARHLLQLINDILDMSKIESGKIELDIRETDIRQLIETVTSTFGPIINKKDLTLRLEFAVNLPQVFIDSDKVRQILLNLMSNAVKFTHQGGVVIRVEPSERGVKPGEAPLFIQVCVEDSGIGIKSEDLNKLFDKFSQIDVSTIRQYEGTGLGLSIARGLVVLHKGLIWAESKFGVGSRLCFTLPARKSILEKPEEPILEPRMAEGLAGCFDKPEETFLKQLSFGGKKVKCWEYNHCGQTSCPAYGSNEHRCWLIFGTHCKGTQVAAFPEKVVFCKGCEIIEKLILEEYTSTAGVIDDQPEPEEVAQKQRRTVLAIDDNPEVIELIRKYIGADYEVVGILSGKDAVAKAKEIKPAAITLDIMMPGRNGWQVLQELKQTPETQEIPVMILSIIDEKKMGFGLGAAEYMVKPIDRAQLLGKLKRLARLTKINQVLVVDSDQSTVEHLSRFLTEAGYKTATADSNAAAIRAIKAKKPDLIVLSLLMVDKKDLDVIEYIKSEEEVRNIPLIIITGKDLSEQEISELDGRVQAILNKGILTETDLLDGLRRTINALNA